jgi:hypothetical protein
LWFQLPQALGFRSKRICIGILFGELATLHRVPLRAGVLSYWQTELAGVYLNARCLQGFKSFFVLYV